MKILAKFLLSSVFVFLPAVVCAQDVYSYCGFSPALETALETSALDPDGIVRQDILKYLMDGQNCLNDNLTKLKESVEFEKRWGSNNNDIIGLLDELKQTKDDLQTAAAKIETLEDRLSKAEDDIQELREELTFYSPLPPHPASRKAPANKPSGFIPDTPATTPRPASKKPDASKPKAPASKPTSGFVPDFPPMSSASKPKAPDSNPTPAVKEGTH
jgi:hypothetical protein